MQTWKRGGTLLRHWVAPDLRHEKSCCEDQHSVVADDRKARAGEQSTVQVQSLTSRL